jgi:predicted HTH domain antitoxin
MQRNKHVTLDLTDNDIENGFDHEKLDGVLSDLRNRKITLSKGAETLNIPLQDLLELMDKYQIPVLDYEPGALKRDLETLKKAFKISE